MVVYLQSFLYRCVHSNLLNLLGLLGLDVDHSDRTLVLLGSLLLRSSNSRLVSTGNVTHTDGHILRMTRLLDSSKEFLEILVIADVHHGSDVRDGTGGDTVPVRLEEGLDSLDGVSNRSTLLDTQGNPGLSHSGTLRLLAVEVFVDALGGDLPSTDVATSLLADLGGGQSISSTAGFLANRLLDIALSHLSLGWSGSLGFDGRTHFQQIKGFSSH